MAERRVPVAVTTGERHAIVVVCDDGTVWELYGGEWTPAGPAVPGTDAVVSSPDGG